MVTLRLGHPYWLDRVRGRPISFPALAGTHQVDVAIVGGGITGCACAYLAAKSGLTVALVEAAEIGRGSTAASTALLMQEPDVDFTELSARYGTDVATRVWQRSRQATGALVRTLDGFNTDAGLQPVPSLYFSRDRSEVVDLRRELTNRHRAGLGGRWLSPATIEARTGFTAAGGILTTGNAVADPYRSCVAFARAARERGALLFTRSKVRRIRQTGGRAHTGVRLELEGGNILARQVVIATGYATAEFKPLAGRFRISNTYVIATPPLTPAQRRRIGIEQMMLWDTERPYHYMRWTADHRLIFGGRDQPRKAPARRPAALRAARSALLNELAEFYPSLKGIGAAYAWEGLFATTPDGLPYIGTHRRYPRHLFALGYGGNGMTFGFLAAQVITRALNGRSLEDDELFAFNRRERFGSR